MTYAIIEASGKQFRVEPGRFYDLDRLPVDEDETVTIDRVLFVSHDGDSMVGQPLVEGATVSGTVLRHLRGRKVIVYKMKPKKKTRKKRGHRQELTRLMIDSIALNGEILSGEASASPAQSTTQTQPTAQASTATGEGVSTVAEEISTQVAVAASDDATAETAVVLSDETIPAVPEEAATGETATPESEASNEEVVVASDSVPAVAEEAASEAITADTEEAATVVEDETAAGNSSTEEE